MRGIYIVGRYPDKKVFDECFNIIVKNGFEFIEVGIPFNDPVADGPVIAGAIDNVIQKGLKIDHVIDDLIEFKDLGIKKFVMTYSNIIYSYGIKKFSNRLKNVLNGIIIADMPNRMTNVFYDQGFEIPIVPFATLESRKEDIEKMNDSKSEIIYFVGVRGITGAKADYSSKEFLDKIDFIKKNSDKKIIIGFGIKTNENAKQALDIADGYVVGTEAVRRQKEPVEFDKYLTELIK